MKQLTFAVLCSACAWTASAQTQPAPAPKKATAPAKPAAAKPAAPAKPEAKPAASADNPVVITIGTEKLTKKEFEALVASLPPQVQAQANGPNKRKFAEQVADMKAMAYEARRRKVDQNPEVKQRLAIQIDNILASELYREVTNNLKVDDAAMQAYYNDHKNEYEDVTARHILIRFKGSPVPAKPNTPELTEEEALTKAKALREKILKGADFAEVAKAESEDTGSGANGGSLGSFGRGQMVPPFEEAAFKLPVGQISEPVKSQFGWHLIKVEAHGNRKFEDVKGQIEAKLKQDLSKKAVEDVKKSVPVVIDETYFGKAN